MKGVSIKVAEKAKDPLATAQINEDKMSRG
jgi:hypothetical protein